jgi:hypothetical protein
MSTRATIACKHDDGRYAAIYLHFDGYPEHAGRVLEQRHGTPELARMLVSGGDIRSLDANGTVDRFSDGNRAVTMPTLAALHDFARNCGTEYVYVFEEHAWHCHKL